ncbi:MAG: 4Fe-4S binding protein, partial [bacterium]
EIPDDRQIAEIYSRGDLVTARSQKYRDIFQEIAFKIKGLLNQERKVKKEVKPEFQKSNNSRQEVTTRPSGENKPDELVVISGKGGTGKTSITASFAAISDNKVIADCDVDASDLHLILQPEIQERGYFSGGSEAEIKQDKCIKCGQCQEYCRFNAINIVEEKGKQKYQIDQFSCEGCGVCALVCDYEAVELSVSINGEWFISRTRFGPLAHARLGIAEENSGQLVSLTRDNESRAAAENDFSRAVIDGSPGTGCPVIASLTGAEYAVIVTEPTVSGVHDLDRILEVADYFGIESGVVVNKADINQEMTEKIKDNIKGEKNVSFLGEIPYDNKVTEAQMRQQSLIEYAPDCEAAVKIREIYDKARFKAFTSNK